MKKLFIFLLYFHSLQTMAQLKPIVSGVYHWKDLAVKKSGDREGRRILEGVSPAFAYLEIHATTQYKGAVPKAPHAQTDLEELIIVTDGVMKFTIGAETRILGKGSAILIPPLAMQSAENIGDGDLTYYVVMFRSGKPMDMKRSEKAGGALFLDADSPVYEASAAGKQATYFSRPTAMCENFELQLIRLDHKGPAGAQYANAGSNMILVLEGETEITVNDKTHRAGRGDLYILNGSELYDIRNTKDTACKYFALKWW